MASEKGMLLSCDRCEKTIFLKYIGKGEADGGYTTWDKFEPKPDTWLYEHEIGYLCDDCARIFREWVTKFMYGKVAPAWDINRHLESKEGESDC